MSRIAFLALMVAAAVGCTSASTRPATTPVAQASADIGSDPSFQPPTEWDMSIGDAERAMSRTEMVDPVHIPKQEKPRGVVHAATY